MLYYNNYLRIFCTAGSVSEDFSSARGGGHSKFIHLCCIIIATVNLRVVLYASGSVSIKRS